MQQTSATSTGNITFRLDDPEFDMSLFIAISFVLGSIVSLLGIWSNIFSMVIFYKIGFKDTISVELFALSCTDCLISGLQLANCICYIIGICYPTSHIDIFSLTMLVFGYAIVCFYLVSCWITTLISVERCLCVVYPFKIKQIFTRSRCIILILTIYIIFIVIHISVYVVFKVEWIETGQPFIGVNATGESMWMLTVILNNQTMVFEKAYDVSLNITMAMLIQCIVTVCALWMGYSIIRQTNTEPTTNIKRHSSLLNLASTLSDREKRLVKVVLFLAVMLVAGNVPQFVITALYHILLSGLDALDYQCLSTFLWSSGCVCVSLGSASNFLVFLKLNSKFRALFYHLCGVRCGK